MNEKTGSNGDHGRSSASGTLGEAVKGISEKVYGVARDAAPIAWWLGGLVAASSD
jgi:hypothetical protein